MNCVWTFLVVLFIVQKLSILMMFNLSIFPFDAWHLVLHLRNHCVIQSHENLGASQVMLMVKNPPANAGGIRDTALISGLGRSPGVGNGNLFQYSCLENSMNRGAWTATVHGVEKSRIQLSMHTHHVLFSTISTVFIYKIHSFRIISSK